MLFLSVLISSSRETSSTFANEIVLWCDVCAFVLVCLFFRPLVSQTKAPVGEHEEKKRVLLPLPGHIRRRLSPFPAL